jgi:hypothetical protein
MRCRYIIELEGIIMASYMCDGSNCGLTDEDESVVARHVLSGECNNAWGVLTVGSPAWEDFQKGVHPMTTLTNAVAGIYTDHLLEENGIET